AENLGFGPETARGQAERNPTTGCEMAELLGIAACLGRPPAELSGGEKQRVAIARALVGSPAVLLADEPTGALDSATSVEVMELFQRLNREQGLTIVLVTHEHDVAAYAHRTVTMRDGSIVNDIMHQKNGIYADTIAIHT
ncbi:MAG: ATP-binding cassette domain-containing protein, partial [Blastochloris sp.]|nr:ATP-binding cassette domain-containing protein [Blastochloris sp.]